MTELKYVEVNPNGYSYCSFPYYWTSDTSVVFENLHLPIQITDGRGVNLFQEGPGRFQSYGNGLDCTPPNDINSLLDIKFGYYDFGGTPSNPYYLLTYEAPNGIDGTLEIGNAYIKLNGTTVASGTTYTGDKVTLTQPFYFFNSFNNSWVHNYIREGYCGKVKFYENGVLSAVYTPYLDDDGVAGYYDENNQTMIYSLRNAWVAGPDARSIKATPSKTSLANTGETISISVDCENAWTVTGNTFLTLSSTGDTGSTTITATAPSYSGATARTDTLTFTDSVTGDEAEITIKQKKYSLGQPVYLGANEVTELYLGSTAITEAYLGDVQVYSSGPFMGLKISPKSFSFNSASLSATCKVKSSESWTMTVPAWLTASTLTGDTGETVVTLTTTSQTAATSGTIEVTTANYSASASCEYQEFTPVNYIHSQNMGDNTNLYITLPVNSTANSKVRITGKGANYSTGGYLIGNGLSDTRGEWRWFGTNSRQLYLDISNNRLNRNDTIYNPFDSTKDFDFTIGNHYWTAVYEGQTYTETGAVQTNVTNLPFLLTLSVLWISTVQIWEGETLVFNGNATKLGNDYGLFDTVGGNFITTTDFTIVGEE